MKYPLGFKFEEWFYTGGRKDLGDLTGRCQLCETDIRYQFEIQRRDGDIHTMLIGSECIKRFKIATVDANGDYLDEDETSEIVQSHKSEMITYARRVKAEAKRREQERLAQEKYRRACTVLACGMRVNEDLSSFYFDYRDDPEFTPKQLNYVFWKLKEAGVPFTKSDFVLSKRKRFDLHKMPTWQLQSIWPCIPEKYQAALQQRFAS